MEKKDSTKEVKKKAPAKIGKKSTSKGTTKKGTTSAKKTTPKVKAAPKKVAEVKKEVVKEEVIVKEEVKVENKQDNTEIIDSTKKEILITILALVFSIIVGFIIGKYLFELMY